jgi:PIN domain nuclease of toxin-antitoxin system
VKVLLDTCTFLWAIGRPEAFSVQARSIFQSPENEVYLSAASAWEIAIKHALGRLPLPGPAERLIPSLRERHGITALPVDEESALHLPRLPALHHDPFDRLLVCQAIVHGMTILTPDPVIGRYPARVAWD